jgi:hypothetical protein
MPAIYLHIGVPKTGTTYLQQVLFANRAALAKAGVLYPAAYAEAHFDAVVDLREMSFGGYDDSGVAGRWQRLARAAGRWDGHSVVISHELLAGASDEAVAEAVDSFAGHEVHVICTARDLGRQVPAMWQEYVKNHSTVAFEPYVERLLRTPRQGKAATVFWRQQHLVEVLRRWGGAVPTERLHLVTVPPPGSEPEELWRRFAAAADLPPVSLEVAPATRNTSLGFAQAELLRRVNRSLGDSLEWPAYEATVKSWFAEQLLAGRRDGPAPGVPPRLRPELEARAAAMVEELTAWGVPVDGELADLRPLWPSEAASAVDDPQVLDAAVDAVAELLRDRARRHWTGPGRRLVRAARRNAAVRRLPEPVQQWLKHRASD